MLSSAIAKWAGSLSLMALVGIGPVAAGASPQAMRALGILEPRVAIPVPDVSLRTLEGKPLSFSELKGKVVLVNFWATFCVPCQWEMPLMENLYQAYKAKGFVVMAISLDPEGAAVVGPFVKQLKLTYPVLLDQSLQGARQFGIRGLPATYLIGRDGLIKGATFGPREWDGPEARELIEFLLKSGEDSKR